MSVETVVQHPSGPEPDPDPHHTIDSVVERVTGTVGRIHLASPDPDRIRELVVREWQRYEAAKVRHFVPVLVHRAVIEQLSDRPAPSG